MSKVPDINPNSLILAIKAVRKHEEDMEHRFGEDGLSNVLKDLRQLSDYFQEK